MKNLEERPSLPIADVLLMLFSVLPPRLCAEISSICKLRRDFPLGLSEIRVRSRGRSSLVISGENIPLFSSVSESELSESYDKALGGALYVHAEELKRGFFSMPGGVRVGVSATKIEAGLLPSEISSLAFRLPSAPSENAGKIFSLWQKERPRGMLIYSSPGGGKTSALRALAGLISREGAVRVAVIDERREFSSEDYSGCSVDILSGYPKPEGIEIAMRTLSPEVIIADEIGSSEEASALLSVGRGGVPIIASAHAEDLSEALTRVSIKELCDAGYFELFVRLSRSRGKFSFDWDRYSRVMG